MKSSNPKTNTYDIYARRRFGLTILALIILIFGLFLLGPSSLSRLASQWQMFFDYDLKIGDRYQLDQDNLALLETLTIKGRSPKTGYNRELFGKGWLVINGCTMRNLILKRDLTTTTISEDCKVKHGFLNDPYSGKEIEFFYGATTSDSVQIDHVVAVSDAWQKGAQSWDEPKRIQFYNDPLNLLAVGGLSNQAKSDQDAASWLPAYKPFRCEYVGRQIQVKAKYNLWVTVAEKEAMVRELNRCPATLDKQAGVN